MTRAGSFYLLGAGFSKALSVQMPLLDQLRDAVLPRLNLELSELDQFDGNFESWLSHLAVAQPWLTDQQNYRHQALFLDASQQVSNVISEAEMQIFQHYPEDWFIRLLLHWSDNSDDLCTFNYDTLIERGLQQLNRVSSLSDIYRISLAQRWAPGSSGFLSANPPSGPVPWLYKLHGSINWAYGGPHAPVSDQITLLPGHDGWSTPSIEALERPRRDQVMHDDLLTLIVPPTTTKGSFYGNLALRAQWRRAFESLKTSESLTVIGYSFPAGDLQARQFIALAARDAEVTVVDRSDTAGATVQQILGGRANVTAYSGDTCVMDFVDAECASLLRWETVRDSEGCPVPSITLNGEDVTTSPGREWGGGNHEDVHHWLNETLDRRWPDAREKSTPDRWAQPDPRGYSRDGRLASVDSH